MEEIAERIQPNPGTQPNAGGLPNTDFSAEAPPRPSGSGQIISSGSQQPSTANSEQAVPIESSSVESISAGVRSWFYAWLAANFVFVISNIVFLAVVFIKSTWLVIYARLLGTLVGLVLIIPCHTPHETHKDKRDRKSVWASLMKTERPKGPEETPKGGREGERTTRTKKRAKQNDHITLKLTSWPTRGVLGLIKLFP